MPRRQKATPQTEPTDKEHSISNRTAKSSFSWISSLSVLVIAIGLTSVLERVEGAEETVLHESNRCAMYDLCGSNDLGNLPCPSNRPAEEVNASLALKLANYCPHLWDAVGSRRRACCNERVLLSTHASMQQAFDFFSGCPACWNNFQNLWCTISCHPDQASFADVIRTHTDTSTGLTAVQEVHFSFSDVFKETVFDSCREVKLSSSNTPVLVFMGNPSSAEEFLGFLGSTQAEGGMAPYSLKFLSENETPRELIPHQRELPGCGSPGYECSCADCSTADYCATFEKGGGGDAESSCAGPLKCYEYGILAAGVVALIGVTWLVFWSPFARTMHEIASDGHTSDDSYEPLSDGNEFCAVLLEGESVSYPAIENWLRNHFRRLGVFIAVNPYFTILVALSIMGLLSLGNLNYNLERTPQGLWTPEGSRTAKDKARYEAAFGEFYRVQNLILATTGETPSPEVAANGLPSIVTYKNMQLAFHMQHLVDSIEGQVREGNRSYSVRLEDVCYKPLGACVTESVLQYWQMDPANWEALFSDVREADYDEAARREAETCFQSWTTRCRSTFQAPIDPKIVLGGYPTDSSFRNYIKDTTAFSITYLLDSREEQRAAALAWEKAFLEAAKTELTQMAEEAHLKLSFMAERSTEDELDRETYMDAGTVVLSYLVMFVYIAISLTFLTRRHSGTSSNVFVQSHVILGLQGVGIVVLAVMGAFGLISLLNIKVSMIVLEVLPFLVLAVGVDNVFILANELRSFDAGLPLSLRVGSALAEVGPSITCAAFSEGLAFGLAAIAPIPAVRNFSLCACFAILLDFFLQCTLFASCLVLDTIRRESSRVDCAPCMQLRPECDSEEPEYVVWETSTPPQETQQPVPENLLQQVITKYYVPWLLGAERRIVRWVVLSLTVAGFVTSCILMGRLEMGMAEQVAFPRDSYLQDYFTHGLPLMRAGAPVMFVVEDVDVSADSEDVQKICGIAGCDADSLVSQIDLAAQAGVSHLASPAASWVDEFLMWTKTPSCCRTRGDSMDYCAYEDSDLDCVPCSVHFTNETHLYQQYLPVFMELAPGEICARGGKGIYEDYIQHEDHNASQIVGLEHQRVQSSAFRSYYVPLVSQNDYIEALKETHSFVDDLKESLGMEIYAYSVFHVYFQQYLNLVPVATLMICLAVGAVFLVCWILLSSFRTALIVMICVILCVIDLMGASYLPDVKLNGVSVVNLTMSVGIAVEFCVHLAHSFLIVPGSRVGRVAAAFQGVGLSVISGIALTKFLGVIVLAFAATQLFRIYYFRMYMALVLLCGWHGLVVLPILLALLGPPPPVTRSSQQHDLVTDDPPTLPHSTKM